MNGKIWVGIIVQRLQGSRSRWRWRWRSCRWSEKSRDRRLKTKKRGLKTVFRFLIRRCGSDQEYGSICMYGTGTARPYSPTRSRRARFRRVLSKVRGCLHSKELPHMLVQLSPTLTILPHFPVNKHQHHPPIMALPTLEEVQSLVAELANVAQAYSTSPDLNGYMSRVQVIAKAKKLAQSLISPEQLPNYHGLNVRLLYSFLPVNSSLTKCLLN
jgi:hypothetical protein